MQWEVKTARQKGADMRAAPTAARMLSRNRLESRDCWFCGRGDGARGNDRTRYLGSSRNDDSDPR